MSPKNRHVLRNFIALEGDTVAFFVGYTFIDPYVVVPAFARTLSDSPVLIGLLTAIRVLAMTVPPLWAASYLDSRPLKRPLLIASSFWGRVPILLLALAALAAKSQVWLPLAALFLMQVVFFISEGLNSISWPDLVGKVIPSNMRGRLFGLGQLFSSIGALVVGGVLSAILNSPKLDYPTNWAVVLALGFVFVMLSVVAMFFIREKPDARPPTQVDMRSSLRQLLTFIKQDIKLRWVIVVQVLLGCAATAFPFFVIRAGELMPGSESMLGVYVVLQSIGGIVAALICGYLIDHVGSWKAIRLGVVVQLVALLAVTLGTAISAPQALYWVAFFSMGFVNGSSWWSFSSYLLEIATPEQRPSYLAASSLLKAPVFLVSLSSGVIYALMQPEIAFGAAAFLTLLAVAFIGRLKLAPKPAAEEASVA